MPHDKYSYNSIGGLPVYNITIEDGIFPILYNLLQI